MTAVDPEGGIEIRDLHVSVAGRILLEGADADFPAGCVTLIIGASGAGKTVLMKILSGLSDPAVAARGSVRVAGREALGDTGRRARPGVGLVFQNFALFDELTSRENIEFAADHRRSPRNRNEGTGPPSAGELLREMGIPEGPPVRALSGGQQQRLALARTLAYDPPVVIIDEPTSGLDPLNAARVADRIRETGRIHGKTTIVVSHDYEHLAPIADKVWVLDTTRRELRVVEGAPGGDLAAHLSPATLEELPEKPRPVSPFPRRILGSVARFFEQSGAALEAGATALLRLIPRWRKARWGLRYLRHYVALLASPSAWIYFAFAGLIAGFVSTYFSFRFLPHRLYTEPLIADEMLRALGLVLYRAVVPVLTTILLAARAGAAVASDVGGRSYSHQLDALRSFGVSPPSYLLTGVLHAFAAVTPLLVAISFFSARLTSLLVFIYNHPEKGADFWESNFHRDLRVAGEWLYFGTWWLLLKVLVCGWGIGTIAYHIGASPKSSGVEVSRGITRTIIWATLWVLVVHFAFAFFEFEKRR